MTNGQQQLPNTTQMGSFVNMLDGATTNMTTVVNNNNTTIDPAQLQAIMQILGQSQQQPQSSTSSFNFSQSLFSNQVASQQPSQMFMTSGTMNTPPSQAPQTVFVSLSNDQQPFVNNVTGVSPPQQQQHALFNNMFQTTSPNNNMNTAVNNNNSAMSLFGNLLMSSNNASINNSALNTSIQHLNENDPTKIDQTLYHILVQYLSSNVTHQNLVLDWLKQFNPNITSLGSSTDSINTMACKLIESMSEDQKRKLFVVVMHVLNQPHPTQQSTMKTSPQPSLQRNQPFVSNTSAAMSPSNNSTNGIGFLNMNHLVVSSNSVGMASSQQPLNNNRLNSNNNAMMTSQQPQSLQMEMVNYDISQQGNLQSPQMQSSRLLVTVPPNNNGSNNSPNVIMNSPSKMSGNTGHQFTPQQGVNSNTTFVFENYQNGGVSTSGNVMSHNTNGVTTGAPSAVTIPSQSSSATNSSQQNANPSDASSPSLPTMHTKSKRNTWTNFYNNHINQIAQDKTYRDWATNDASQSRENNNANSSTSNNNITNNNNSNNNSSTPSSPSPSNNSIHRRTKRSNSAGPGSRRKKSVDRDGDDFTPVSPGALSAGSEGSRRSQSSDKSRKSIEKQRKVRNSIGGTTRRNSATTPTTLEEFTDLFGELDFEKTNISNSSSSGGGGGGNISGMSGTSSCSNSGGGGGGGGGGYPGMLVVDHHPHSEFAGTGDTGDFNFSNLDEFYEEHQPNVPATNTYTFHDFEIDNNKDEKKKRNNLKYSLVNFVNHALNRKKK